MLLLASLVLGFGGWQQAGCPTSFSTTETTIGAITSSSQLSVCVSNAVLVKNSSGSLSLVLNSTSTAPRCLIYPNGLSPDLTFSLLDSGHVGCWSLYPPSQPIAIVNISGSNSKLVSSALKKFQPVRPQILVSPKKAVVVGAKLQFSSTSKIELINCKILGLDCKVRFTPISYRWLALGNKTSLAKPSYVASSSGSFQNTLSVTYKVEYVFPNLTPWQGVYPNISLTASPVLVLVSDAPIPSHPKHIPRLVDKPCSYQGQWGC